MMHLAKYGLMVAASSSFRPSAIMHGWLVWSGCMIAERRFASLQAVSA
jgi:hypothetical protein